MWPGQPGAPCELTCVRALHILACQNTTIIFFYVINVWFMVNVTQRAFQTHLNLWLDLTLSSQLVFDSDSRKVLESWKQDFGLLFLFVCNWLFSLGRLPRWVSCTFQLHACMCGFLRLGDTVESLQETCKIHASLDKQRPFFWLSSKIKGYMTLHNMSEADNPLEKNSEVLEGTNVTPGRSEGITKKSCRIFSLQLKKSVFEIKDCFYAFRQWKL